MIYGVNGRLDETDLNGGTIRMRQMRIMRLI